jgi:small-conductance mechanosensitive channel
VPADAKAKQRLKTELLFCFLLLVILIVFFVMCMGYHPTARRAPLVVMTPLTVMVLGQILILGRRYLLERSREDSDEKSLFLEIKTRKAGKAFLLIVSLLILIALIYLVGLIPATAVFLIVFLRFVSRERWVLSLVLGLSVPAVLYVIFQVLLHIYLYPGLIDRYI